ncbi:MAG: DUF6602 domain-containing protein [Candidatus Cybelea sp.]
MSTEQGVSELLAAAAQRVRSNFEFHRSSSLHEAEKGAEVEGILRAFLNEHLPRRFASSSAHLIDVENAHSKQCDVVVYDALTSPVYRASSESLVLPVDNVAAVIEVKTSLDKRELTDAYEKIASCKRLKKRPASTIDRASTGSDLSTIATMGIVFGFSSGTTLGTLAENAKDLNERHESRLWPGVIVVLDKGVITYVAQFPGQPVVGMVMPATSEDFIIPPAYQILSTFEDGLLSLNRFFVMLLSQLMFFAHRPSTPTFTQALVGASQTLTMIQGYQYDTSRKLQRVSVDDRLRPSAELRVLDPQNKVVGQLVYFAWQDGAIVGGRASFPLGPLLGALLKLSQPAMLIPAGDLSFTSVVKLTEAEFMAWTSDVSQKSNLRLELFTSGS